MSAKTAYVVMVNRGQFPVSQSTEIDNDPPNTNTVTVPESLRLHFQESVEVVAIYASASEADMSATLLAKYASSGKRFYTIEKPLFIAPRSRKEMK
jgi:hypothetical protein